MIDISAENRSFKVKDKWEELNSSEFVSTIGLLHRLMRNELSFYEFRLELFQLLSGYVRSTKNKTEEEIEQIDSNLFILANMLHFPTKPHYPDPSALEVLTPELRKKLATYFPFEIYEDKYQAQLKMVKDLLTYEIAPNFNLKKNPLPFFKFKEECFYGPEITIDKNGLFDNDIIAGEYLQALEYHLVYKKTKSKKYLRYLAAFLYRKNRKQFDVNDCKTQAKEFKGLPDEILYTIEFIFQNLQEIIINLPDINILYSRTGSDDGIKLGLSETLYNLSQEGYGSFNEVMRFELEDYLKMQLKRLIAYVKELRVAEKKENEIAKKTGLSISALQKIK